MKQKIKEALRQEYKKRLELDDEQLDGVAAFAATFVTDDAKIEEFVKNDATLEMLKSYQRMLDKDRAKRKSDGEQGQQGSETGNQSQNQSQQQATEQPDLAAAIAAAVAEQMKTVVAPLQEKLTAFEAAKAKENAVSALDNFVNSWDYASGFPKERDLAKRVAMEVYKAGGEQLNGEQLIASFRQWFDPAVKEKGVTDFSKPFKGDGGGGEAKPDFKAMAERLKAKGKIAVEAAE